MQNEKEIYMKYLLSGTVAPWISTSFPIIQTVLLVLIALCSVVIIVAVLMHPSDPDGGNNAITGVRDSYYMQNRGMTKEGILNKFLSLRCCPSSKIDTKEDLIGVKKIKIMVGDIIAYQQDDESPVPEKPWMTNKLEVFIPAYFELIKE